MDCKCSASSPAPWSPTLSHRRLALCEASGPETIQTGQVITFLLDEDTTATHRVVDILPDEDDPSVLRFRTKGDANQAADGELVYYKNVVGTPVFSIPYLGYVAEYIRRPPGTYGPGRRSGAAALPAHPAGGVRWEEEEGVGRAWVIEMRVLPEGSR